MNFKHWSKNTFYGITLSISKLKMRNNYH